MRVGTQVIEHDVDEAAAERHCEDLAEARRASGRRDQRRQQQKIGDVDECRCRDERYESIDRARLDAIGARYGTRVASA